MFAVKSIKQCYNPKQELEYMMEIFRNMVNQCIRIGLVSHTSTLKKLSLLSYNELKEYDIPSYYKLCAISQACGRLSQMKHSIKQGRNPKSPFVSRPYIISCYGFRINGMLLSIPAGNRKYINIPLNDHTAQKLSEDAIEPRSFVVTPDSISISIRKDVPEIRCNEVIGIDRNLRNITISTPSDTIMYRTNKLLSIKENTMHVSASFTRNDRRVKNRFYTQKRNRRTRRVQQFLHMISKDIVQRAKQSRSMIVLEDIKGIRKLYRKGNGQGKKYRRRLNSWSFYELQRQIEYKAAWQGIPVQFVDPKRTSQLCPVCGVKCQEDRLHRRKLWCGNCKRMMDRDVVASMNIAYKGWTRFIHPRGLLEEAMKGNVENIMPLILRVDGSKLVVGNV